MPAAFFMKFDSTAQFDHAVDTFFCGKARRFRKRDLFALSPTAIQNVRQRRQLHVAANKIFAERIKPLFGTLVLEMLDDRVFRSDNKFFCIAADSIFDDAARRTDVIRRLRHLETAFRMRQKQCGRMGAANAVDVLSARAHVRRTAAMHETEGLFGKLMRDVSAEIDVRNK